MTQNLNTLKSEIVDYAHAQGFVLFHGFSRIMSTEGSISWDTRRHPDHKAFLEVAAHLGVKLIVLNYQEFVESEIDGALDLLEEGEIEAEERRSLERRLREMRVYQGLISTVELSFDHEGRAYIFHLLTDWFREFMDTVDEIDSYMPDEDEDKEEDDSLGGYYSRN